VSVFTIVFLSYSSCIELGYII